MANQKNGGGYKWRADLNDIIREYLNKGVTIRPDWEHVKIDIMREILQIKFENPHLKMLLKNTGNKILIEHTSRDSFWGDGGNGSGLNWLGRLLMEIRGSMK